MPSDDNVINLEPNSTYYIEAVATLGSGTPMQRQAMERLAAASQVVDDAGNFSLAEVLFDLARAVGQDTPYGRQLAAALVHGWVGVDA